MIPRPKRLTLKQRLFAKYYNMYGNKAQAARLAGYSLKTAHVMGQKLFDIPKIRKIIEVYEKEELAKVDIEANKIIKQYQNLATSDIGDYYYVCYSLRFTRLDMTLQSLKTKERLAKYIGYEIDEDTYHNLSKIHQTYYMEESKLKPLNRLTKAQRAAIQSISHDRSGNLVLRLSNKETSLDSLSKIKGLYEKDNAQKSINLNVEQRSLNDFYETIPDIDKDTPLQITRH